MLCVLHRTDGDCRLMAPMCSQICGTRLSAEHVAAQREKKNWNIPTIGCWFWARPNQSAF